MENGAFATRSKCSIFHITGYFQIYDIKRVFGPLRKKTCTVFGVSDQVKLKQVYPATETSEIFCINQV